MRKSKGVLLVESAKFRTHLTYRARKRDNEVSQRCVQCPKTVEDGYACCRECRAKMAAGKRAAVAQGRCVDCWTEPVIPGKKRCIRHDALRQRDRFTRYTDRLVRRQCVRCGKARAQAGITMCQQCATRQRDYEQKKRQHVA